MADGVWKRVQPKVIGLSEQHSVNKFYDPSTPSMRKGRNGGKGGKKMKKITVKIVATNVIASQPPTADRLQCQPLVPISVLSKENVTGETKKRKILLFENNHVHV